jgi:hypothetical protein
MSAHYTPRTVFVAAQTATGSLRLAIEKFLTRQPNRDDIEWPTLKKHITASFLSPHEDERLRHELTMIKRGAYENTTSYGRRFSEAAELAYPQGTETQMTPREADMNRILLNMYLRGLNNKTLAARLIRETNPATYEEAMIHISKYESDDYRLSTALAQPMELSTRQEEPMEIGAVDAGAQAAQSKTVQDLERRVSGMSATITKLISMLENHALSSSAPTPRASHNQTGQSTPKYDYKFTDTGRPICHYCQKVGHIAKDCRSRLRDRRNNATTSSKDQGGSQ